MIDNMLAAVGVVVGSFIAAIFKMPFGVNVFRVGTSVYAIYLAVFPMTVGLLSAWQRYRDSQSTFKKRKEDFAKRLTQDEIQEIVGDTVSRRERWFRWWFVGTALAYATVLSLVITAIIVVPNQIRNWSDEFELTGVSYGVASGENIQVIVRGQNFDKDREIVVEVGLTKFTNTDGGAIKVHGSTVLAFLVRQKDIALLNAEQRFVSVRQGMAGPQKLALPSGLPPIAQPAFEQWSRTGAELTATGTGFDSIASLAYGGSPLEFKLADGGKRLTLPDFKPQKAVADFDVTLYNGAKFKVPLPPEQVKKRL